MNVAEFLDELTQRGINIWAEGDHLRYRVAKGVLTPEVTEEIQQRKAAILAFLRQPPSQSASIPPLLSAKRETEIPLSFAQEQLWFLQQLEPESSAYVEPDAVQLGGPVQVKALEQSINAVVQRHENLRTTFVSMQGTPYQAISATLQISLPVIDLCALAPRERLAEAERLFAEAGHMAFDLSRGPLLHFFLLRCAPDEHILLATLHHIIADRTSGRLFIREVFSWYHTYVALPDQQVSPSLPDLPVQYADYVLWQRGWLQGEALEYYLRYWRQQLAGAPPLLELPTDLPRPARKSYDGSHFSFTLPATLTEHLRALSRREGTTLFMTMLAAFETLLMRYSGQPDITVGTPVTSRGRREMESLIGLFINTLVLRTDLSGNPTFRQLLKRVREVCLDAYEHQEVPFEKLVEALRPERNLSHSPIFQIMFTLEHEPVVSTNRAGLTLKPVLWINNTAKFDLSLTLVEDGTHLQGNFDYSTDLFTAETISRLTHHFQTLLESIVTNPDQPLSQLALLSPAEQQQLLHAWQQPVHPATEVRCFHRLFEEQVQRTPKALAVTDGDQRYTYQEVNTRANQLAHYLRTLGVGPEVRVGLCLERSLEMLVSLLGILKVGGAYVPLDPTAPRERLAFLAQDADLALILCQQQLQEQFSGVAPRLACVDGAWDTIAQNSQENLAGEASGENLVYVMYTSGSTGTPKGVMITQRGLSNYLRWAVNAYQGEQGRGAPVHSALTFDLTITSLLVPLLSGQTVVLVPETAGEMFPLGRVLHEGGFSLVKLTPAHLELLAHTLPAEAAAGMATRLVIGGEALNGEGLAFWRTHAPATRIVNEYGPTETVVGCCVFEQAAGDSKPGPVPIGRPIANMQVYVLDSELGPAPIGVPGEIYIGGVGVARGYLGRPDLTAERFIPHPFASEPGMRLYRTGDLARYRADGELEYLGRNDQQVKVRGFRIEPGEIEAALTRHAGVREALVVALEESAGDKRLVAYLVADGQKDDLPANEQVRQHLQTLLPDYMIPAAYVWLEELPLTAHGKIDRAALPAPDWASQVTTMYVAPRTPTEECLASLWAQLLRCERVGVHDNFFELGGHSLLATRLIARVSEAFRLSLPLRTLFEAPTLASFAARLEQQRDAGEEPEEVPLVRGGRYNILAQKPSESH